MARSPTDTIRFLTLEELARLFAVVRASPRNRALFLIAYRHGLRASEVGLLRTDDLDFRHAITPLIWDHVNPYGRYELDMESCMPILT